MATPASEARHADPSEQVQRAMAVAPHEDDREEVERRPQVPLDAEPRLSVRPRSVIDGQLGDAEAEVVRKHRNEAMALAVQPHVVEHLGPVRLQAAVHVVQLDPRRQPRRGVVDPRDEAPDERVVPVALPARDDVEAVVELRQEIRDLGRVVLQIRIHRDDHVAGGDVDSRRERGSLAEVPAQAHDANVEVCGVEPHELAIGPVRRAVVDEHDLPLEGRSMRAPPRAPGTAARASPLRSAAARRSRAAAASE